MYNLKAVIIGAGIGGLTTGIALRQAGYEVEIYDQAKDLRPTSAGLSLWSNGVKVLNRLGLGEQMARIAGKMERMQYRSHTDELLNEIDFQPLLAEVGQCSYAVARADLRQMLLAAYPGQVKLNFKCVAVEDNGDSITATFENGYRASADVLIAADGIYSTLRQYVLEEVLKEVPEEVPEEVLEDLKEQEEYGQPVYRRSVYGEPVYRGYVNWNGLVKGRDDLAPKNTWVVYVGEHKRASIVPLAGDRFYFFFDVPLPQGTTCEPEYRQEELEKHFSGWAEPIQTLLQQLDPLRTNRLEIQDVGPLDRLVRGRMALLGDAGHALCPDLGQGGCQAMEDAEVLTHYLLTTNMGVEAALKRYEAERKARTHTVTLKARKQAARIHGEDSEITQKWYEQLRQEEPEAVTGAIAKVILAGPMR